MKDDPIETKIETLVSSDSNATAIGDVAIPADPFATSTSQADTTVPLQGWPTIPGYQILGELGRGGMGVVYRARQVAANRLVALKVVRNELLESMPTGTRSSTLERFRTEAQAAAHLQHDNLVSVYEIGEVPTNKPESFPLRYYAMRFIEGRSLIDILRDGPLDNKRAAKYMEPVARALQLAHSEGILHRDLKPHNIMIERATDRPLVADFGLAKFIEGHDGLTHAGEIMGTPAYMSPEQAQDAGKVTASADLYSLGATLYHLLTGRPPFHAANIAETLRQIIHKEPVTPRQLNAAIDRDLETICLKCLQKDPTRRYANCAELAADLSRYLQGLPIIARPIGLPERVWRWCRRNPIPASLTTLAASLAIATMLSIVIGYRNTTAALATSESRLERALAVVDELFTRVSEDELLDEPGMQPLRKDLLEKALKHYNYFREESGKEAIDDEVAASHFRVGVISQLMGDLDAAEKEFVHALKIQGDLLASDLANTNRLKSQADTLNALGSLHNAAHRFGESVVMFQKATAIRLQLATLEPDNLEFQRLAASSLANVGLSQIQLNQYQEGLASLQKSQEQRQALLIKQPDDAKVRRDFAMGWYNIGKAEIATEEYNLAKGHLRQAISEFQILLVKDARSMKNRYMLGVSLRFLGGILLQTGDTSAGIEAYESAISSIQPLAANNPDVTAYQTELAVLALNLGTHYLEGNDFDRAMRSLQQARELTEKLLIKDPSNPDQKGDLAAILGSIAEVNIQLGKTGDAIKLLMQAKELLGELLESDSQNKWFADQMKQIEEELANLQPPVSEN